VKTADTAVAAAANKKSALLTNFCRSL